MFVDLAYISAGEGAMNIEKVNCLHAAITGYAPLVFDCDVNCDCNMFLDRCKLVWRELETNPDLPQKLVSFQTIINALFTVIQLSHATLS